MAKLNRGVMALVLIGGFYAWRNRLRIQRFLEAQGIDVPVFGRDAVEKIQSMGAKLIGKTEHADNELRRSA